MANTTTGTTSTPTPTPTAAPDPSRLEEAMARNQAFQFQIAMLQTNDQMVQACNHGLQQSANNIR